VTARRSTVATGGPGGPGALEVAVAHVLQVGTYLAIGLVAVGSVLLVAGGTSPLAGGPPLDLGRIPSDLTALRPEGFLWLGILAVAATPALRVVRAALGFVRRGERSMAWVALAVLAVVGIGVVVGVVSG
jgi:uncharacterized membrane protein